MQKWSDNTLKSVNTKVDSSPLAAEVVLLDPVFQATEFGFMRMFRI